MTLRVWDTSLPILKEGRILGNMPPSRKSGVSKFRLPPRSYLRGWTLSMWSTSPRLRHLLGGRFRITKESYGALSRSGRGRATAACRARSTGGTSLGLGIRMREERMRWICLTRLPFCILLSYPSSWCSLIAFPACSHITSNRTLAGSCAEFPFW
jgi:hypothetical protein